MRIYADIKAERDRQDKKWGKQSHPHAGWYVILGEEFGEVGRAIFEGTNIREELVQVAAVAAAWIEQIDEETADRMNNRVDAVWCVDSETGERVLLDRITGKRL